MDCRHCCCLRALQQRGAKQWASWWLPGDYLQMKPWCCRLPAVQAFIHRCDLERMRELLDELSDEDREFLMTCFAYENDYIKRLSQKYGMTGSAVLWKKEQILKKLKKAMFSSENPRSYWLRGRMWFRRPRYAILQKPLSLYLVNLLIAVFFLLYSDLQVSLVGWPQSPKS